MRRVIRLLPILFIAWIYRYWFISREIIGGDWPYFSLDHLRGFSFFVPSWMPHQINGFGGPSLSYALESYMYAVSFVFVRALSLPWHLVYKSAYFGLFLVLSYVSPRYFLSKVVPAVPWWQRDIASLVYATNTFMLMVAGGGQMGVALAIASAPFALGSALGSGPRNRRIITTGVLYAAVTLFDARVALLLFGANALFMLVIRRDVISLALVTAITVFLHATWILPMIVFRFSPYDFLLMKTLAWSLPFFSFATFSNGLALLHPNWPENVFGKVYFLRAEFLLIPIVAFIGLSRKRNILYCAFLTLVGVFFAKGAQEPFGAINSWVFERIPGFSVFRDPTKFSLYIMLGYLVLIPAGLSQIVTLLQKYLPRVKQAILLGTVLVAFVAFWGFSLRDAVLGRLGGTLRVREVPSEYTALANLISSQPDFSRTLWYPRQQRFAYYTNLHPSVEANHFFAATNSSELASRITDPKAQDKIQAASIKYVIVPYDSEGEIFTDDRKYDDRQWQQTVAALDRVPWLINKQTMGKITLYEVPEPQGRFHGDIRYTALDTTRYSIQATGLGTLVFSERFDPSWKAKVNGVTIASVRTPEGYNSFELPNNSTSVVDVYFDQENVYTYGRLLSLATGAILLILWLIA